MNKNITNFGGSFLLEKLHNNPLEFFAQHQYEGVDLEYKASFEYDLELTLCPLKQVEGDVLNQKLAQIIYETIVAFANTEGGMFVLGVAEKNHVPSKETAHRCQVDYSDNLPPCYQSDNQGWMTIGNLNICGIDKELDSRGMNFDDFQRMLLQRFSLGSGKNARKNLTFKPSSYPCSKDADSSHKKNIVKISPSETIELFIDKIAAITLSSGDDSKNITLCAIVVSPSNKPIYLTVDDSLLTNVKKVLPIRRSGETILESDPQRINTYLDKRFRVDNKYLEIRINRWSYLIAIFFLVTIISSNFYFGKDTERESYPFFILNKILSFPQKILHHSDYHINLQDDKYQISIIPPSNTSNEQLKIWVTTVYDLLKDNGYEPFIWHLEGKKVIEIPSLSGNDNFHDKHIISLLKNNGLFLNALEITKQKESERTERYHVEFVPEPSHQIKLEEWGNWVSALDELLEKNNFDVPIYYKGIGNTQAFEGLVVDDIPYPPWTFANDVLLEFEKKQNFNFRTIYKIYKSDPTGTEKKYLVNIEKLLEGGISMEGFIPLKFQKVGDEEKRVGNYKILVKSPKNEYFACKFKGDFLGFRKNFPHDFSPTSLNQLASGTYETRIFVDGRKIFELQFYIEDGNFSWDFLDKKCVYSSEDSLPYFNNNAQLSLQRLNNQQDSLSKIDPTIQSVLQLAYHTKINSSPIDAYALFIVQSNAMTNKWRTITNRDSLSSKDNYKIILYSDSTAYLYVFQIDSRGRLDWLFPQNISSPYSNGSNPIPHNQWIELPDNKSAFHLDKNEGIEHLYVIATKKRWSDLEKTLLKTNQPNPKTSTITTAFNLKTRGVGGTRVVKKIPSIVTYDEHEGKIDRLIQSKDGILVFEKWFKHIEKM